MRRALIAALFLGGTLSADDWPTYMRDNARVGWTPEPLRPPLAARWVVEAPRAPQRAWPEPAEAKIFEGKEVRSRVSFDDVFHVAVAGGRVFFGSSVENRVSCRDLDTGRELWSFFAEGPVRLAPTAWDGRVYFGADDGVVTCLEADSGAPVWKLRAGPRDERILARGRMTSRWAVRTGVLVDGGTAYFGAGVFPHDRVYLYAVDARTGRVLWKNDTISDKDAGRNDLTPQGYLLASDDTLFVPSARSLPAAVSRATGEFLYKSMPGWRLAAGGQVGGTQAFLADNQLYAVGEHHVLAMDEDKGKVGFGWFMGRQMTLAGDRAYLANGKELFAVDRLRYAEATRGRHALEEKLSPLNREIFLHPSKGLENRLRDEKAMMERAETDEERRKHERAVEAIEEKLVSARKDLEAKKAQAAGLRAKMEPFRNVGVLWKAPSTLDSALILAAGTLVAGGKDEVAAFDAATGVRVWGAAVEGEARGLAAAGGCLLVSTSRGRIYCFGDSTRKPLPLARAALRVPEPLAPDDLAARTAEAVLARTGVKAGYGLVLGGTRLAVELARRTELQVYLVEPEPAKAREMLAERGLYGTRITVDASAAAYPRYFADLVVSETWRGVSPDVARHVKPAGGKVCLPESAAAWLAETKLGEEGARTETSDGWAVLTRGKLPGSDAWSHQYGNPGNSSSNQDFRVRGGLSVLWYGDPGPAQVVNRHAGAVGPVSANGRLFIQGDESVIAVDAYNGRVLWDRKNPDALRTGVFNNLEPGNLAATDDALYMIVKGECLELDAATGERRRAFPVGEEGREWGYLAVKDGTLYGTSTKRRALADREKRRGHDRGGATDRVFAIDLKTGGPLWSYQGRSISHTTVAVGEGKVVFIDSSISSEEREDLLRKDRGERERLGEERMRKLDVRLAVALDAATGRKLWSEAVDVTDCSDVGIGAGRLTLMLHNNHVVLCGANANGHYWPQFLKGEFKVRRLVVLSGTTGQKLWAKEANYRIRPLVVGNEIVAEPWAFDLYTGEQKTRPHPMTGEPSAWKFARPGHHCGPIASSPSLMLFRSGTTAYYDLETDSGTRHFAGHRLGCWINAIPANGLVLVPEASAGCICLFSIAATVAFEPREESQVWGVYSAEGAATPVRHLALNLAAPGDRRDAKGRLWLAYPRPASRDGLDLKLDLKEKHAPGGGPVARNAEGFAIEGGDPAWVFASGFRGLLKCSVPLLGPDDAAATYTARLYFAGESAKFGVRLQDRWVAEGVTLKPGANLLEFTDVRVTKDLAVEIVSRDKRVGPEQLPLLCGLEILRSGEAEITK